MEKNCSVQDLPYSTLRAKLIADGQILENPKGNENY